MTRIFIIIKYIYYYLPLDLIYNTGKVKTLILSFLLFFPDLLSGAQERDLAYYLEQAKANSPLINKSLNENKIVALDLQQIYRVLSKPEINFVSGIMLAPIISHDNDQNRFELVSEGAADYTGYDLALTDGGHFLALVSVNQPLLSGSKYKAYSSKAGISERINSNNISLTIHELEQIVGYQYILCLKSKMQADNSLILINEMNDQVAIMQKLVDNAVYKKTDLMILQIELQKYMAEYQMFMADYQTNLYDLNLVCGISDTSQVELLDIHFKLNPGITENSNFLVSYKLDSLNILADQAISDLKYKPRLDLFADVGLNAAYLPYPERIGFSTGLSLNWNIFDGNQRKIQREKSAINLQTIEFEKNNFMTLNDMNKNKILNQITALVQRIILNEKQADQYASLYDAYSRELSQGEISVMDFKNLLKDIAAVKQEIILQKLEKQILINSYNYLNY